MTRALKNISGPRLCDEVVSQLEQQILSGDFQQGDKLPSESILSEQAGVSRRAIRDALKILETKGLIEVRKGSGAFVARNDYDFYLNLLIENVSSYLSNARATVANVLQFRVLIEGSAVEALAMKHNPVTISALNENLSRQRDALKNKDIGAYNKTHWKFHAALVEGLDNPIINMLYQQVALLIRDRMMLKSRDFSVMENSVQEHSSIIEKIEAGDSHGSRQALIRHFDRALANLSNIPDDKTA
ncbi:MAG: FadR/GntR family transcriptional regulator [Verrucomicrobia bacterium]|nr:FadR/GntR family transcriptional regulator [Verrucomicrobiota bacterium]